MRCAQRVAALLSRPVAQDRSRAGIHLTRVHAARGGGVEDLRTWPIQGDDPLGDAVARPVVDADVLPGRRTFRGRLRATGQPSREHLAVVPAHARTRLALGDCRVPNTEILVTSLIVVGAEAFLATADLVRFAPRVAIVRAAIGIVVNAAGVARRLASRAAWHEALPDRIPANHRSGSEASDFAWGRASLVRVAAFEDGPAGVRHAVAGLGRQALGLRAIVAIPRHAIGRTIDASFTQALIAGDPRGTGVVRDPAAHTPSLRIFVAPAGHAFVLDLCAVAAGFPIAGQDAIVVAPMLVGPRIVPVARISETAEVLSQPRHSQARESRRTPANRTATPDSAALASFAPVRFHQPNDSTVRFSAPPSGIRTRDPSLHRTVALSKHPACQSEAPGHGEKLEDLVRTRLTP